MDDLISGLDNLLLDDSDVKIDNKDNVKEIQLIEEDDNDLPLWFNF